MPAKEIEKFNDVLEKISDDSQKIEFIDKYLQNNSEIELDLLASIYETLAELHLKAGRPKGSFYKKAASNWEIYSVHFAENEDKEKRAALKKSFENYKKALYVFKNQNEMAEIEMVKEKMDEVKRSLKEYTSSMKKVFVTVTFFFFIFSLFFLVSSPTGLVIAPIEPDQSATIGGVFAFLAIVGVLITRFVIR